MNRITSISNTNAYSASIAAKIPMKDPATGTTLLGLAAPVKPMGKTPVYLGYDGVVDIAEVGVMAGVASEAADVEAEPPATGPRPAAEEVALGAALEPIEAAADEPAAPAAEPAATALPPLMGRAQMAVVTCRVSRCCQLDSRVDAVKNVLI